MKRLRVALITGLPLVLAAGCAGPLPTQAPRTPGGEALTPQAAQALIAPGAAKADVAAALGPALQVDFDNGHAVWAYRWPDAAAPRDTRAATELVILFDREGRVQKLRLRPGYR